MQNRGGLWKFRSRAGKWPCENFAKFFLERYILLMTLWLLCGTSPNELFFLDSEYEEKKVKKSWGFPPTKYSVTVEKNGTPAKYSV